MGWMIDGDVCGLMMIMMIESDQLMVRLWIDCYITPGVRMKKLFILSKYMALEH